MKLNRRVVSVASLVIVVVAGTVVTDARAKDAEPQMIEIHAKKFGFSPAEITLHKGKTYKLHFTSDDVPHSLRIKSLNLNAKMKAGEYDDVLFTPEQDGDYKADCGLYCGFGHNKMSMMVHVVDK